MLLQTHRGLEQFLCFFFWGLYCAQALDPSRKSCHSHCTVLLTKLCLVISVSIFANSSMDINKVVLHTKQCNKNGGQSDISNYRIRLIYMARAQLQNIKSLIQTVFTSRLLWNTILLIINEEYMVIRQSLNHRNLSSFSLNCKSKQGILFVSYDTPIYSIMVIVQVESKLPDSRLPSRAIATFRKSTPDKLNQCKVTTQV